MFSFHAGVFVDGVMALVGFVPCTPRIWPGAAAIDCRRNNVASANRAQLGHRCYYINKGITIYWVKILLLENSRGKGTRSIHSCRSQYPSSQIAYDEHRAHNMEMINTL